MVVLRETTKPPAFARGWRSRLNALLRRSRSISPLSLHTFHGNAHCICGGLI
jgi:hypothetical protein